MLLIEAEQGEDEETKLQISFKNHIFHVFWYDTNNYYLRYGEVLAYKSSSLLTLMANIVGSGAGKERSQEFIILVMIDG